jgi:hypothetical protein
LSASVDRLEVRQERVVRLHGDDPPVLRPHLLEQRQEQLAPLDGLGLQLPEAGEVSEQRACPVDSWIGRV